MDRQNEMPKLNRVDQLIDYEYFSDKYRRQKLTNIVMRLLDEWQLTTTEQLNLLGLCETSINKLTRYRNGISPLPCERDKFDRAGILLSIYELLDNLFADQPEISSSWLKSPNENFHSKRPLDFMMRSLFGMAEVMRYLEHQMARA